ncbi:MAG: hypothetical protein DRP87_09590 [Spirochaetes bacterium]|nr:MAG: hypothetical protein DRP87_09590 [Spirochaetota bacterium]
MNIKIELAGSFRAKTGVASVEIDISNRSGRLTVSGVLEDLEKLYGHKNLNIFKNGKLQKGILVYLKSPDGKSILVTDPHSTTVEPGYTVTLAHAMEGG